MKPLDPSQELVYVPKADRSKKPDEQTRFVYENASGEQMRKAREAATPLDPRGSAIPDPVAYGVNLAARVVRRVENFGGLEWPAKVPDRVAFLERYLSPSARAELAAAIVDAQDVSEDEARD